MNIEYNILLTVFFRHRYFSDSKLNCLSVTPDQESTGVMNNHGLLFKQFRDGFRVFYGVKTGDVEKEKKEITNAKLTLRFMLTLTDPLFYNYTSDFTRDISSGFCYFHNIPGKREQSFSNSTLQAGEFVSEKDTMSAEDFPVKFFTKPFGIIDLLLHDQLEKEYTINFHEKETYWRYILMSDHLKHLSDPAVVYEKEVFLGPKNIVLPDNREAVTFESASPISIFQVPEKKFKLVENYDSNTLKYKIVLNTLPLPDVKDITLLPREKGKENLNYSEIFIY